jgi:hypothetical protein
VWLLAGAALALQTARHAVDFSFPGASGGAPARPTPGQWLRRIAGFPIGERLAAISLTAALFDARVTFLVLLVCGGAAALYGVGGRVARALRGRVVQVPDAVLAAYRDDGPLARPLAPLARLGWAGPPLLRVVEYAGILAVGAAADAAPAAFALLCAAAFHHYETVYRLQQRGTAPPAWVGRAGLGWAGRLLAAAAIGAAGAAPAGLYVLAAALGALFAGEAIASWRRAG